jgi:hypothetical protein
MCRVVRKVSAAFLCIALAGCGLAREAEELREARAAGYAWGAAQAECNKRYAQPKQGQMAALATCLNDAERLVQRFQPYPDLLELKFANRLAIAAKLDRGQISSEDAQLEAARMSSHLTSELERRLQGRRSVEAQEATAGAAQRSSLGFTCRQAGYAVICN